MSGIEAEIDVRMRDRIGRFAAIIDAAGVGMAHDMVETTARFAHENAPVGPGRKDYVRRPKLSGSIGFRMTSAKAGVIEAKTGHAGPQEKGAGPHPIPNAFGMGITVMHPGNAAQPYLRPAYIQLQPLLPGMLEKWYP